MTEQAESANIVEITLAATLCYRQNMIRVPETLPDASQKAPVGHQFGAFFAARVAQGPEFLHGIDAAPRAYAFVAEKDLFTQIGGLRSELPLVNAKLRAKREAPRRHLERTPAAQSAAVGTARHTAPIYPPSPHIARNAHLFVLSDLAPRCV
jgi:hypothetical protein